MNSLMVIYPYKFEGMWVFDDEQVGLLREPFIQGADTMLDDWTKDIYKAKFGIKLIFSGQPFPGYQHQLNWRREEYDGNWYYSPELDREGWLCPALFKYFESAPKSIYLQCQGLVQQSSTD